MGASARSLLFALVVAAGGAVIACHEQPNEPSPPCSVSLDPPNLTFTSGGGTGIVAVSTSTANCTWTATASGSWISILAGASGMGTGSIKYAVAANATPQARSGVLAVGGQIHAISQSGQGACEYDVSPASATFTSAGGQATLTILTTSTCSWTATTAELWLTIVGGASGQGNGSVAYTVAAHTGSVPRTGLIHVAGRDVQVTQSGPGCTYTVTPVSVAFGSEGGQGTVSISAPAGCGWTTSTSDSWLSLTQGASGQGDGSVQYTVAKQTTSGARTGVIHVAGVDVRVVQSGDVSMCEYSVSPVTFSPCMPGTTLTASVVTGASCPWTAASNVGWMAITIGQSGTGPGVISFATSDNYEAPRAGVVQVRWPAPTQGQNLQVAQAGCSYALSKNSLSFPAAGGSASFDVYQSSDPYTCGGPLQDACVWTAVADSPWIVISPSGPTRGDNPVHVVVSVNGTGVSRTGTIRVKDKIVVVTQSGS